MRNKSHSWSLYLTATKTGQRPSDLVEIADRWAALQFDSAITFLGTVIENAAQEMVKTGSGKDVEWKRKYYMEQLLDPAFRLPRPKTMKEQQQENFAAFKALAGVKVVRR